MLEITNLMKAYPTPNGTLPVLEDINLKLERGDAVSIMGPSGSGKSTLLYILGALDTPTSGFVTLDQQNPFALDEAKLATFRNQQIGFVFQDHCLLPQLTVLENVLTPTLIAEKGEDFTARAKTLLAQVGLSERLTHRPAELSGGEKQRVAIARALIMQPTMLLCDEPTGNLDHHSADTVAELLFELHKKQQTILVVVTHNGELAARFPKRFEMVGHHLKQL